MILRSQVELQIKRPDKTCSFAAALNAGGGREVGRGRKREGGVGGRGRTQKGIVECGIEASGRTCRGVRDFVLCVVIHDSIH